MLEVQEDVSLTPEGLPKRKRLLKPGEFRSVFKQGRRLQSEHLVLVSRHNGLGFSRLGVSVSKKTGRAVIRNRIKRYIREVFRRTPGVDPLSQDMVVVLRRRGPNIGFFHIRDDFRSLIHQLK